MASIFMQMEGVEGEATETNHTKWIEIESCAWSHSRTIAAGVKSNQRSRGETFFNDISIMSAMHKGSMPLQQHAATGTVSGKVEIHFCRTGADAKKGLEVYLTIKLTDCLITNYSTQIAGEGVPYESYSLNFTKVEMEYKEADSKGKLTTVSSFTYDKEKASAA